MLENLANYFDDQEHLLIGFPTAMKERIKQMYSNMLQDSLSDTKAGGYSSQFHIAVILILDIFVFQKYNLDQKKKNEKISQFKDLFK